MAKLELVQARGISPPMGAYTITLDIDSKLEISTNTIDLPTDEAAKQLALESLKHALREDTKLASAAVGRLLNPSDDEATEWLGAWDYEAGGEAVWTPDEG